MSGKDLKEERQVLDARMVERSLRRIANQIVERNQGTENLLVVGIQTRGVNLAERLVAIISDIEGAVVPTGKLDITLYRDDLRHNPVQPTVRSTDLPADITGMNVVLVDDVFYTGRTIRAALDAIVDFGRPSSIMLAVLIDRGHQELPIRADFTGREISTRKDEDVVVRVSEVDGADGVWIKALG
ncbi:MAG: bifunctional pyr operon transcriptional regulator/uracil phosphoribosyltransferase PyrR [Candidatus Glassbacteria bacterium]|nr:bifunctional pyr operon transcriptional regulator/uracil phosphoribosyltransferase PyrR [Candidatus Glassbacteria bacterium]